MKNKWYLLDGRNLKQEYMDYMQKHERCIRCEHMRGFRNKIPICSAEKCVFEDTVQEGAIEDGNKD